MLSQDEMELILGSRRLGGFAITNPCPAGCTLLTGYTTTTTITNTTIGSDSNYKTIVVTTSGLGDAVLTMLIGDY